MPENRGTVAVVGASGVVGQAVLRHFARLPGWRAIGLSRRPPFDVGPAEHVPIDLTDRAACKRVIGALRGITHLVYAAVYEKPGLIAGWTDHEQMQVNLAMLRNVIEPLERGDHALRHVTAFQGGKAYGIHIDPNVPVPARERWPRHPHENFYWLQEDYLRERQPRSAWHWTVLRPRLVFGDGLGSNMNPMPALAVYATLRREAGLPLAFPGGAPRIYQATDADLIGRACEWAATSASSHDAIFNVANGDEFVWQNVWPTIADAFGMEVGDPEPASLAATMPALEPRWAELVDRYALGAPKSFAEFVGQGFTYADFQFNCGKAGPLPASIVSTIRIRQAGFADCIDTEDMLRKWIDRFERLRWIPPRGATRVPGRR